MKVTTRTTIVFCELGIELCMPGVVAHAMPAEQWNFFLR